MIQKIFKFILLIIILFPLIGFASTENNNDQEVIVYLFDDRLCPVCRDVKNFLEKIKDDYPQLELIVYPINDTARLREIAEQYQVEDYGIMAPTIFINDEFFQFNNFTSREQEMIIQAIKGEIVEKDCCKIKIPFLNIEVDISNWSLPVIAIILGSVDGFNVCSIGALILVLSIVMVLDSKKKIFFLGGIFILTAVIIYGTLVFLWGKLFEILVGQIEVLRIIIGLASFAGGVYFFKEFYRFFKHGPTCKTSDSKLAQRATNKLKQAFQKPGQKIYFLAGSIMFFAAVITIVELPCSVGIPIAFAGILIENQVSFGLYIFYILIYLFFYMLIEIIIFIGAVLTKKIWFAGSKTITWITFIGAMVLFYLAFYYIIGF